MLGLDRPFHEMNGTHFLNWLAWINQHDWCDRVRYDETRKAFACEEADYPTEYCATPRQLRNWAGY